MSDKKTRALPWLLIIGAAVLLFLSVLLPNAEKYFHWLVTFGVLVFAALSYRNVLAEQERQRQERELDREEGQKERKLDRQATQPDIRADVSYEFVTTSRGSNVLELKVDCENVGQANTYARTITFESPIDLPPHISVQKQKFPKGELVNFTIRLNTNEKDPHVYIGTPYTIRILDMGGKEHIIAGTIEKGKDRT